MSDTWYDLQAAVAPNRGTGARAHGVGYSSAGLFYVFPSRFKFEPAKQVSGQEIRPTHLVVDSTGLKIFGEGEWLQNKH